MHIDLDQSAPEARHATVCIVGGGIAGLTLATRLAEAGLDVHLLDAGGLEQEERSQRFYQTEQPGVQPHRGAHEGRFRTFGGSSTQWGGQLLPFTADIFAPAPGCPSQPWPIGAEDLAPYYPAIERIFAVDPLPFDAALLPALGHPGVPFPSQLTLRFSKWAPFHRRNLAHTLGREALAHPRLTVFTHANAATLEGDGNRIREVRVLNYAGTEFRFTARHFVVATGTIESARLLLSSPGVPNQHDQLGRYFHDHLSFAAARFTGAGRRAMLERLGPFLVAGTLHTCKIEASAATRARDQLLAAMAHVVIVEPEDSPSAALRRLLRGLQAGRLGEAVRANLLPLLRGAGELVRFAWNARVRRRRPVSRRAEVLLNIDVEQSPDPENRIRLSPHHDALGLPVAIVDWRVNQAEQQTAQRFAALLRPQLEALGLAPEDWDPACERGALPRMHDTYHAMGGLRMGTDPRASVVDPDLRVHGLSNLSVASCAVFPSGSSSNPTFTLMALTLRLADHLAEKIRLAHSSAGER